MSEPVSSQIYTLVPETVVQFLGNGKVQISHPNCHTGLEYDADILLILWDLANPKPLEEILSPWPPDDQVKIKLYINQLSSIGVVTEQIKTTHEKNIIDDFLWQQIPQGVGAMKPSDPDPILVHKLDLSPKTVHPDFNAAFLSPHTSQNLPTEHSEGK